MKKNFLTAAFLLFIGATTFTSCQKEEGQLFRLSITDQQKTTLGSSHQTYWSSDDAIYVNGLANVLNVTQAGGETWTATADTRIDAIDGHYYAFFAGRSTATSASLSADGKSYSFSTTNAYTYDPTHLNSPMAGVGVAGSENVTIYFSNLFTMLEIDAPISSATNPCVITITELDDVNNAPLAGDFVATFAGDDIVTTCTGNGSYSLTITKTTPETKVCIPLPAGNHKLDIFINQLYSATQSTTYNFKSGYYYNVKTIHANHENVVPYPFPVGDSLFFFGKGNMSYIESRDPQWLLEPNQWDTTLYTIGTNGVTRSGQLVWMTQSVVNPASMNNGSSVKGPLYPQGYAALIETNTDLLNNWTIPSRNQWAAVLGLGTPNPHWAYCQISYTKYGTTHTTNGLIFAPETSTLTNAGLSLGTYSYSSWSATPMLTSSEFEALEAQGAIFLPACGTVKHQGNNGTYNVAVGGNGGNDGHGWYRCSNKEHEAQSVVLHFNCNMVPVTERNSNTQLGDGICVRLLYFETISTDSAK